MAKSFADWTSTVTHTTSEAVITARGLATKKRKPKCREGGILSIMTTNEAIAKAIQLRDYIRNYETDKLKDISETERREYMDALSILINIGTVQAESKKVESEKTGLELFTEMLAERESNRL